MANFDNPESVVVTSKIEISPEGIECLFGCYGEIFYMHFEKDQKTGLNYIWICYPSHAYANKAIELDGELIAGNKVKVHPAQNFIHDIKIKQLRELTGYSYSEYSDVDDEEASASMSEDDFRPIQPTKYPPPKPSSDQLANNQATTAETVPTVQTVETTTKTTLENNENRELNVSKQSSEEKSNIKEGDNYSAKEEENRNRLKSKSNDRTNNHRRSSNSSSHHHHHKSSRKKSHRRSSRDYSYSDEYDDDSSYDSSSSDDSDKNEDSNNGENRDDIDKDKSSRSRSSSKRSSHHSRSPHHRHSHHHSRRRH